MTRSSADDSLQAIQLAIATSFLQQTVTILDLDHLPFQEGFGSGGRHT